MYLNNWSVKMGKEKSFETKIKDYIENCGGWFIKYWGGGKYTKTGIPDLLACINGDFYGIEVKSETGKPSTLQLMNLNKINNAGGYAILLYPKDFENFKKLIQGDKSVYAELKKRWLSKWERQQQQISH